MSDMDALPSPDHVLGRTWRRVLDYYGDSITEAKHAYMATRKHCHPGHGGSSEAFHEVEKAWEEAGMELRP